uniref:non-specific serine/threonine protein kinase n=1 Tax=Fagus sylvatica TaxID=28930 RepID=A0A2N9F9Q1_FAGSY
MATTFDKVVSLVFLVQFVMLYSYNVTSESTEQANALLKWKSSLENHTQPHLSSWTLLPRNCTNPKPSTTPCTWFGISCNPAGDVIRINLTSSGLKGTLHEFPFSSFPNLAAIDLYENELFGTIPPQFSNLSKLIYLDLSYNKLSGEIPPQIGQLTNIEVLHLVNNQFNGSIPRELGKLKSLTELALFTNALEGPIPASFGNLSNLVFLYLYENQIFGSIPPEMGNLSNLDVLQMDINLLIGPIPSTFGNLIKLTELEMSDNQLSGPIPSELGNLRSLLNLRLSINNLFGSIPTSFGGLRNLSLLEIFDNKLSGNIPEEIGNLKSLVDLELSGNLLTEIENLLNLVVLALDTNYFTGFLPQNICQGGVLQNFTVNNNHLIGSISKGLRNCTSLFRVRLNGNHFTGNISEDFGVYPNLYFIDLSNNSFYGEMSHNWGRCLKLQTLWVARNNITGGIPPEIGNSTELHVLDLSMNHLVGEIPKELGRLNSLEKLMLNGNQLSGGIPQEIGSLTDLEYLDISSNKLSKSFPGNLDELLKLNYLNLSYNKFSQEIPVQLGKLVHLSQLDLSHNSLSGEIPWQISNLESLENLNLSHNNLSGSIPMAFARMHGLLHIDISYNELRGAIPDSKAFKDAPVEALQGNKGLCGDVRGLQSCNLSSADNHISKGFHKVTIFVIFPLLGALSLMLAFFGISLILKRRKKELQTEQNDVNDKELFMISTFDGRILYEEIIKATNAFDSIQCVGEGGHGRVYKAKLPSGDVVAVKKLQSSPPDGEETYPKEFLNEIRALTEIRHRNIVKLYGFCSHPRHSFLIYKYFERGSLAAILSKEEEAKELDWSKRLNIIKGVAYALSYMHHDISPPIIHRDISSNNILLDCEYEAHISDFGTAKLLKPDTSNWTALAGTYGYIATSFGVLALEVIKGEHPGEFISSLSSPLAMEDVLLKDVLDQRLPPPSSHFEDELINILKITSSSLKANPHSRPTMQVISQMLSTQSACS